MATMDGYGVRWAALAVCAVTGLLTVFAGCSSAPGNGGGGPTDDNGSTLVRKTARFDMTMGAEATTEGTSPVVNGVQLESRNVGDVTDGSVSGDVRVRNVSTGGPMYEVSAEVVDATDEVGNDGPWAFPDAIAVGGASGWLEWTFDNINTATGIFAFAVEVSWYGSPGTEGTIVYEARIGGPTDDWELCLIGGDGTGFVQLTSNGAHDYEASLCPDGTKVAYIEAGALRILPLDGSGGFQVCSHGCRVPRWSPDGTTLVYAAYGSNGSHELWEVAAAEGSTPMQLTFTAGYHEHYPDWSRDGRLAFVRYPTSDGNAMDIWTMDPDGTDEVRVTTDALTNFSPQWSPDCRRILYTSHRSGQYRIWSMDPDGTYRTQLTANDSGGTSDQRATWSPGGDKIVFERAGGASIELCVADADGANITPITSNGYSDCGPFWGP